VTTVFECLESFALNHSGQSRIAERVADWSDGEFQQFFSSYSESAAKQTLVKSAVPGFTDVFPDACLQSLSLETIKQLSLYANRIYIHDPILELSQEYERLDYNPTIVMATPDRAKRLEDFKVSFSRRLADFAMIQPLVDAGVVHVTPTQLVTPIRDPAALYADTFYSPDGQLQADGAVVEPELRLPPAFSEYVNKHLVVMNAMLKKDGRLLIVADELKMSEMIAVMFDDQCDPMCYVLGSVSMDDGGNSDESINVSMRMNVQDPQPVDENTFRNWVRGECQKYVKTRLNQLSRDLHLAGLAGARFLTSTPSNRDLLSLSLEEPDNKDVVSALLNMELPYLNGATVAEIAKARSNEAAFHEFRVALEAALKEIDQLDENQFRRAVNEIGADLLHAKTANIESRLKTLQRNVFLDATLALGSLCATIVASGSTLLTAAFLTMAATATLAYKKEKEKQDEIRRLPSYFYWEATKGSRSRKSTR